MPDVDEGDGGAGVQAEDAHRRERRYHARQEAEHVRDGGHGDGDRRLAEGPAHPLLQLKCPVLLYVQEAVTRPKVLNRTILSN